MGLGVSPPVGKVVAEEGRPLEIGSTVGAPAQFPGAVARPGPAWIGLQPGNCDSGPFKPISSLMLDVFLHASLAAPSCFEPAPKH